MLKLNEFWLMVKACAKPWDERNARIKKRLDEIWRGINEVRRDYDWIPLYFRYRQPDETNTVDDRTWSDLEMDEVFARIDRTTSVIGRQYLYALLRTYNEDDPGLRKRSALYSLFRTDREFREKIQRALYPLHHSESAYLTTLLYEELPPKPKYYLLLYLSSGLFFLSLGLIAANSAFIFSAAALAFCNLLINIFYGRLVFRYFPRRLRLVWHRRMDRSGLLVEPGPRPDLDAAGRPI